MLYIFFSVIPRRLNFICRRFETLCSIFIGTYLPTYEDGTDRLFRRLLPTYLPAYEDGTDRVLQNVGI